MPCVDLDVFFGKVKFCNIGFDIEKWYSDEFFGNYYSLWPWNWLIYLTKGVNESIWASLDLCPTSYWYPRPVYQVNVYRTIGPLVLVLLLCYMWCHYENTPMPCTAIFHGCKNDFSVEFFFYYFQIFAQNIYCGYTLEPLQMRRF